MTAFLNKTYTRNIAAGGSEIFQTDGRYLHLESASPAAASTDLLLTVDDVVQGFIAPGVGYDTEPGETFKTFRIENTTIRDITVRVVVGFGRIRDNRIQGVVGGTPVDVQPALPLDKYTRHATVAAGGAGTRSQLQIYNPANSERLLLVDNINMYANGANYMWAIWYDTALPSSLVEQAADRRASTVVAQMRYDNTGVLITASTLFKREVATRQNYQPPSPFVLTPGTGMMLQCDVNNLLIEGEFFWREVPI